MQILITGVTGFLGGELLVMLSKEVNIEKIYCLVRGDSLEFAQIRLENIFNFHGDFFDPVKVIPVVGDLTDDGLSHHLSQMPELKALDTIIHCAANTSFFKGSDDLLHRVNIDGTDQVLTWAQTLAHLKTFVHVSTATVCGMDFQRCTVHEESSPAENARHLVAYCRTKMIAETHVRRAIPQEKLLVVRPSIIMGDSRGLLPRSYVILWTLAAFDLLRLLPVNPTSSIDIISVDYVARSILALLFARRRHTTYHISAGTAATNTALMTQGLGQSFSRPAYRFIPPNQLPKLKLWAKNGLPPGDAFHVHYKDHLTYLASTFHPKGSLRKLLYALEAYFGFIDFGQIYDNTRLLHDTALPSPEPAHAYMTRNQLVLKNINVLEGSPRPQAFPTQQSA